MILLRASNAVLYWGRKIGFEAPGQGAERTSLDGFVMDCESEMSQHPGLDHVANGDAPRMAYFKPFHLIGLDEVWR